MNIVFCHVQFDGKYHILPQNIHSAQEKKHFVVRSISWWTTNPQSQGLPKRSCNYVLPLPAEPMPPASLLSEEMTVLIIRKFLDSNQTIKNQNSFSNLPPTS